MSNILRLQKLTAKAASFDSANIFDSSWSQACPTQDIDQTASAFQME